MLVADPLRVLRAVRFSSRFDFELDSSLVAAARSPEVQTALGSKVSRERFGEELGKMMTGQQTALSVLPRHYLEGTSRAHATVFESLKVPCCHCCNHCSNLGIKLGLLA